MRLAQLGAIGLCLLANPAQANDPLVRLTWAEPAPAGSEAVITLRAQSGRTVQTLREDLAVRAQGHDIALPPLPRAVTSLQAGLISDGRAILQGPVLPLAGGLPDQIAFTLSAQRALGFYDHWDCGDAPALRLRWTMDGPVVKRNGQETAFIPGNEGGYLSQEGERFEITANRAMLEGAEGSTATCAPALHPPLLPTTAFGLNPDWRVTIGTERAEIDLPGLEDESLATTGLRISAPRDGRINFRSAGLDLTLTDSACRLSGIDLLYPITARLRSTNPDLTADGCAGNPLDFLAGIPWRVTSLLSLPLELARGGEMTLHVSGDEISGRGTCNRYLGSAHISDGKLVFRDLGTTRLSCSADLRNLELRFLDALESATGFEISASGQLTLRAGVLPVLTAQRQDM